MTAIRKDRQGAPPHRRRRPYTTGDPGLDTRLQAIVDEISAEDPALALEMLTTVVRMAREPISQLDRKIINASLKEMRYAFRVFSRYRDLRKATIFGSARVKPGDPNYDVAREVGLELARNDWMVVTGAGPGIMRAANQGAGQELSFGFNIVLPFENQPNEFVAGDPKLINFKYFFTRKLMFIKEADAFVLFPGGFGTMDEVFELLTLMQTGKSDLHPVVMLEAPGGSYWREFDAFMRTSLRDPGYVNAEDLALYSIVETAAEAVDQIQSFYRLYHSQRYVGDHLVLRLNAEPDDLLLATVSEEFADILGQPIRRATASAGEIRDNDVPELPRISLEFNRVHFSRLKQLIVRLNAGA